MECDYVYDYYDNFEIEKDLSRAFQVAEDLLFQKEYKEASILYDRLLSMCYYKAAVLIATLGETLESNGMKNGRTIMIEHYKKIYTRKRAFKSEFEMLNE